MSSKQVTGLDKLGRRVAAATADPKRNERAMLGVIARCSDVVPEGTTSITLAEAQHYLGRQIEHEIASVRRRDNVHVDRLTDVNAMRKERNQATLEVYGASLRTRRAFELVHGEGSGAKLLGIDTTVPEDPTRLHQTVERCREWLRDETRKLPAPELAGFRFDRLEAAAGLDAPLGRLGKILAVLPEEEKHTVDTLVSKMSGMQRLDQLIGRAARMMEALYDVAGMEGESDRVRLSSHRSRNASPPPVSDQPAAEQASSGETPAGDAPEEVGEPAPAGATDESGEAETSATAVEE